MATLASNLVMAVFCVALSGPATGAGPLATDLSRSRVHNPPE
jgi:hypothetical protein